MRILHLAGIGAFFSAVTLFGPPQITVRAVNTSPTGAALELDVKYHTEHDDVTVLGRAEGVRAGKRVSVPLTITRQRNDLYSVARQWESGSPWVLLFTVEQGKNGSHGFAQGIVSIDAAGKVKHTEYVRPSINDGDRAVPRVSPAKVDAALKALGASPAP